MKRAITGVVVAFVCAYSWADAVPLVSSELSVPRGAVGASQSQGQTTTVGSASNAGISGSQIGTNTFYSKSGDAATASAIAPMIVTSNDTCMGSTTGSITTTVVAISAGSTWTDDNCVMLKNARELWNMGMRGAALARLCMDPLNREALEVSGTKCPARIER